MSNLRIMGVFACFGGYALNGNPAAGSHSLKPSTSIRSNVSLGNAAASWRAKRLLEEAQMDWKEAQIAIHDAPDNQWISDYIEDFVDPDSIGLMPPLAEYDVVFEWEDDDDDSWPTLELDEVDLEIFDI